MKPVKAIEILLTGLLVVLPATTASCRRATSEPHTSARGYSWRRVIESGKGCFQDRECAPGQWAMAIIPLPAFDKLFIVGWKEVWSSSDGINWTSQAKTDWGERHGMAHVFFDNKMWMTGGMQSWDKFKNDVWYSTNGRDWKLATPNAPWAPRRNHRLLVFNNKMWLIGGAKSSGRSDQTPTEFFNDVWSSTDGVNWTQVTVRAAWDARDGVIALNFGNKLWVMGGEGRRDVWSSADGKTWTQATAAAAWTERRGSGGAVFDGKMWIFGGLERNDVWFSTDGRSWQAAFAHVFDGKLWLYGGKTGRPDSWVESGDVWIMSP